MTLITDLHNRLMIILVGVVFFVARALYHILTTYSTANRRSIRVALTHHYHLEII
jgi:hypothetical protein